ncbi:hypothetical protein [Faecalibaculum rodentium]|uniref:hypothetical protein n=1 Tax=Faecalibaculum rodentium TaxID=1702221 RepID=UPI002609D521|nr:hypothetical protein [Faecalibaculum rodentium]
MMENAHFSDCQYLLVQEQTYRERKNTQRHDAIAGVRDEKPEKQGQAFPDQRFDNFISRCILTYDTHRKQQIQAKNQKPNDTGDRNLQKNRQTQCITRKQELETAAEHSPVTGSQVAQHPYFLFPG